MNVNDNRKEIFQGSNLIFLYGVSSNVVVVLKSETSLAHNQGNSVNDYYICSNIIVKC